MMKGEWIKCKMCGLKWNVSTFCEYKAEYICPKCRLRLKRVRKG